MLPLLPLLSSVVGVVVVVGIGVVVDGAGFNSVGVVLVLLVLLVFVDVLVVGSIFVPAFEVAIVSADIFFHSCFCQTCPRVLNDPVQITLLCRGNLNYRSVSRTQTKPVGQLSVKQSLNIHRDRGRFVI